MVVIGLMTSLSASFTRWRANNDKEKRMHNTSVMSNQSLMSSVSDTLPSALLGGDMPTTDCDSSLLPEIAATPKMMRKRRSNDAQPFSTAKKLV